MTAPDDRSPDGTQGPAAPDVSGPTDPDAIRADIETTREELGATVDELSHRLDIRTRAREGAARGRDTAVAMYRKNPPAARAGGATLLAALVGLVTWRRRRARRRTRAEGRGAGEAAATRTAARRRATKPAATRARKRGGKRLTAQLAAVVTATNKARRRTKRKARQAAGKKR
jgi:hypothetical protein